MDQQQTLPINPRLDSSVLPAQPASDWAKSTESALGTSESPSTAVRGETSHVIQANDSSLDTSAKSQSHIDRTLAGGTQSTVSTPGLELPGAWTDKPTTANQILNDAGTALASVGSAAYNVLPESVKGVFSNQTTTTSPVQTTTNHSTTTPTQNIAGTAQSTLSKVAEVGTTVAGTAATGATALYERVAGTTDNTAGINKSAEVMPTHQTATLPSQDVFGQPAHSGPMGGTGALPGHRDETGVAILPDDKEALANRSNLTTQPTTGSGPTYTDSAKGAAATVAATLAAAGTTVASTAQHAYNNPDQYVPAALAKSNSATTESTGPTYTDSAKGAAATVGSTVAAAGTTVSSTAQHVYNHPDQYIPGMPKSEGDTMPYHQTSTLPSQDKQGQLPFTGPMDGVGALPGSSTEEGVALLPDERNAKDKSLASSGIKPHDTMTLPSQEKAGELSSSGGVGALPGSSEETGVALLPEEKAHPNPLAGAEFTGAKANKTLADPYHSDSPYSNTDANAIQQPSTAKGILAGTENTHSEPKTGGGVTQKVEEKAEVAKEKVLPTKPASTHSNSNDHDSAGGSSPTSKKPGFMDKLKGQSKIISGKMSKNEEKIAEGQALKRGVSPSNNA